MTGRQRVPGRRADIACRVTEDGAVIVLLPPDGGAPEILVLNETAKTVWELLDGRRSMAALGRKSVV